jgi:hypothetical protein
VIGAGQVIIDSEKQVAPTACGRWYKINIMASGKVALCCMDGEGKHVVGDVNEQSVLDIYNAHNYKKYDNFHLVDWQQRHLVILVFINGEADE